MKSRNRQLIAVICTTMLMGGCATNQTEAEKYESRASYEERRDEIRAYINGCEAAGFVVTYTGPTTHKLRNPIKRIPRHAHPTDYRCATVQNVERFQAEMGLR